MTDTGKKEKRKRIKKTESVAPGGIFRRQRLAASMLGTRRKVAGLKVGSPDLVLRTSTHLAPVSNIKNFTTRQEIRNNLFHSLNIFLQGEKTEQKPPQKRITKTKTKVVEVLKLQSETTRTLNQTLLPARTPSPVERILTFHTNEKEKQILTQGQPPIPTRETLLTIQGTKPLSAKRKTSPEKNIRKNVIETHNEFHFAPVYQTTVAENIFTANSRVQVLKNIEENLTRSVIQAAKKVKDSATTTKDDTKKSSRQQNKNPLLVQNFFTELNRIITHISRSGITQKSLNTLIQSPQTLLQNITTLTSRGEGKTPVKQSKLPGKSVHSSTISTSGLNVIRSVAQTIKQGADPIYSEFSPLFRDFSKNNVQKRKNKDIINELLSGIAKQGIQKTYQTTASQRRFDRHSLEMSPSVDTPVQRMDPPPEPARGTSKLNQATIPQPKTETTRLQTTLKRKRKETNSSTSQTMGDSKALTLQQSPQKDEQIRVKDYLSQEKEQKQEQPTLPLIQKKATPQKEQSQQERPSAPLTIKKNETPREQTPEINGSQQGIQQLQTQSSQRQPTTPLVLNKGAKQGEQIHDKNVPHHEKQQPQTLSGQERPTVPLTLKKGEAQGKQTHDKDISLHKTQQPQTLSRQKLPTAPLTLKKGDVQGKQTHGKDISLHETQQPQTLSSQERPTLPLIFKKDAKQEDQQKQPALPSRLQKKTFAPLGHFRKLPLTSYRGSTSSQNLRVGEHMKDPLIQREVSRSSNSEVAQKTIFRKSPAMVTEKGERLSLFGESPVNLLLQKKDRPEIKIAKRERTELTPRDLQEQEKMEMTPLRRIVSPTMLRHEAEEVVYRLPQTNVSEIVSEIKKEFNTEKVEKQTTTTTTEKKVFIESEEEIERVASRVYDLLESRFQMENQRRGLA